MPICFVATVLEGDRDFRSSWVYELTPEIPKRMCAAYPLPSLMKLFNPEPRPVTAALPPRATVIAVNTALLPPGRGTQVRSDGKGLSTYCHCGLRCSETTVSTPVDGQGGGTLTNNEVNLRTEVELEECVTHEVNHLDPFDDTHSRDALAYVRQFATPLGWNPTLKRTPTTFSFFTSSALS